MSNNTHTHQKMLERVKLLIPPLSGKLHKGQAGRLGVVGGSADYTGAPFFSAMGAMRIGVDLAHIICEPTAGSVIKTYSPDLIVHRILDFKTPKADIEKTFAGLIERLHVLVVGPGLGRDDHMQSCAELAIRLAREKDLGLVIDADGLWYVQNHPDAIKGYKLAILTPNVMEMKRLAEKLNLSTDEDPKTLASRLSKALGGVTVLQKGPEDIISNGKETLTVDVKGGLKRCGGQGDILSGAAGTLLAWGRTYEEGVGADDKGSKEDKSIALEDISLLAAYGASTFNRTCSRVTFEQQGRSMVTDDMLPNIKVAYAEVFGDPLKDAKL